MRVRALTTVEASGGIAFPQATFTFDDTSLPKTRNATFEYKIVEVVKVGDTWRAVRDVLADKTFDPAGMHVRPDGVDREGDHR